MSGHLEPAWQPPAEPTWPPGSGKEGIRIYTYIDPLRKKNKNKEAKTNRNRKQKQKKEIKNETEFKNEKRSAKIKQVQKSESPKSTFRWPLI